jgi:hypothetical protein
MTSFESGTRIVIGPWLVLNVGADFDDGAAPGLGKARGWAEDLSGIIRGGECLEADAAVLAPAEALAVVAGLAVAGLATPVPAAAPSAAFAFSASFSSASRCASALLLTFGRLYGLRPVPLSATHSGSRQNRPFSLFPCGQRFFFFFLPPQGSHRCFCRP